MKDWVDLQFVLLGAQLVRIHVDFPVGPRGHLGQPRQQKRVELGRVLPLGHQVHVHFFIHISASTVDLVGRHSRVLAVVEQILHPVARPRSRRLIRFSCSLFDDVTRRRGDDELGFFARVVVSVAWVVAVDEEVVGRRTRRRKLPPPVQDDWLHVRQGAISFENDDIYVILRCRIGERRTFFANPCQWQEKYTNIGN